MAFDASCRCIAEGKDFGPWAITRPRSVLYVDGEMAIDSTKARYTALSNASGKLSFLHHEWLFHQSGTVLNLSNESSQRALLEYCRAAEIEVLILDNLSCLFSGIRENDADAWELVLPWLLDLRRNRIAVIFVHHAGRNGTTMRGTSRREDAAFWVLQLSEADDSAEFGPGAIFVARFTKNRNCTDDLAPPI